jgi:O-antigen biosynthesis protein
MSIFNHVINFVNRFRLTWDKRYLMQFDCGTTSRKISQASLADTTSSFRLASSTLDGWYVLELQLAAQGIRVNAQICMDSLDVGNSEQYFHFPVYLGRLNKRLIKSDGLRQFQLNFPLAHNDFQLLHFRLVRVTQKFANSRMLNKLRAVHPRYQASLVNHRHLGKADVIADARTLWTDYCDVFDETVDPLPYSGWIKEFDTLTDDNRGQMQRNLQKFSHQPLVSVVMPVHNPEVVWLEQAIASVQSQIYTSWELCVADDASSNPAVRNVLERYMQSDPRIKVVFRAQNGHISAASNAALALAQGEWVALLDHDDVLAEHALYWVVDAINRQPDCRLIYSDEDKMDDQDVRSDPYFKCEWNADLFYSQNMFSHLGVYYTSLLREVGGFQIGFEGAQDHDLALRCIERVAPAQIHHIARVLYHWRMHASSTAHHTDAKPYAMVAGVRAINEHMARRGVDAKAEYLVEGYRLRYALPLILPLVSLIIPTRNGLRLLRQCVESILAKTTYANYEIIIIDNGSDDQATLCYMGDLALRPNVRVVRDARPFNYSALNNAAVKLARGSVVGLINNDTEVISPDWLTEMVSHALRPEVGAVGARLWYSDDTLQHAGVILGIRGVAEHAHRFLPRGHGGYFGRAALIQSFSVVTGACIVVRKALYEAVGGLNEVELQVACNDIDFCLRLREAGYRNIYTPYAELYHHESASRGFDDTPEKQARSAKEVAYMHQRWGDALRNDPAYSPNLTLDAEDFSLAWPPRLPPLELHAHLETVTAASNVR